MSNVVKSTIATLIELADLQHGSSIDIEIETSTAIDPNIEIEIQSMCQNGCILLKPSQDFKNSQIAIFDLKGTLLYSEYINILNGSFTKINHSKMNTGVYYLSLSNHKEHIIKKIFIHD